MILMSSVLQQQLSRFTRQSLRSKEIVSLDPRVVLERLKQKEGERIWAVDIGGTSCTASLFTVANDELKRVGEQYQMQSTHGKGYLPFLRKIGEMAEKDSIPVAVSSAGEIENNRYVISFNIATFLKDLHSEAGGDFHYVFPTFRLLLNDAVCGCIAATATVFRNNPEIHDVLYAINGSGIGGSVYQNGKINSCEPGDIAVVPELNKLHQQSKRTLGNQQWTTLEQIGASKAGIEDMYFQLKGLHVSGREISRLWQQGDTLAKQLYEDSALVTAHAILGIAHVFGLLTDKQQTMLVLHGGVFHVQGYRELVESILNEYVGFQVQSVVMNQENPGMKGAAIAAITDIS